MRLTLAGRNQLIYEEGVVLVTYPDLGPTKGTLTIGIGHTTAAGPPAVRANQRITFAEAIQIFERDIVRVEADVLRLVKVPLAPHQFDALVSFQYNTGGLARSKLLVAVNQRAGAEAIKAGFLGWTRAGNDPVLLKPRRLREAAMFNDAHYTNPAYAPVWTGSPYTTRPKLMPFPAPGQAPVDPPEPSPEAPAQEGEGKASPTPGTAVDEGMPGVPPIQPGPAQSKTIWSVIAAFFSSGGSMFLAYIQSPWAWLTIAIVVVALAIIFKERIQRFLDGRQ